MARGWRVGVLFLWEVPLARSAFHHKSRKFRNGTTGSNGTEIEKIQSTENFGAKSNGTKFRERNLRKFVYTSRGCALSGKFQKCAVNGKRNFMLNVGK